MAEETAILVDGVSKDFVLPHEKTDSIKGIFTGAAKKRAKNKSKETQHALKDISFEIKQGEFFGIVGRNGSGKSTLLKILAGIYQPTEGKIYTQGKLVPFIELGVGFNPELTGRENVYLNGAMLGFSEKEVEAMYDSIVKFAELERFMDQKLKNYSSGMQVRLAFSMAIRAEADILLIDEVLAVGDADFQRKCYEYFKSLKKNKKTVVFVSHDMSAVREYCDRAVLIDNSHLVEQGEPHKIATSYTRMFMEQEASAAQDDRDQKRWGDKAAVYTKVTATPQKAMPKDKEIILTLQATAKQDVENAIFGFSIKNSAFAPIQGTNSAIANKPVPLLKKGETIEIEWKIPNIFNDGMHYADFSIIYKGGNQVADWWEEAVSFKVFKDDKTSFIVSPSVSLKLGREAK